MAGEIKTVPTKKSVAKYIALVGSEERRKDCEILLTLMEKVVREKPIMWGESLVGFGKVSQTYSTGKKVEWLKMGFASRKDSISIYFTCNLDEYTELLEKLGRHKRGVGCLYIKRLVDVDLKVLEKLLESSLKANEVTKPPSGISTVDQYVETFPNEVRIILQNLRETIRTSAPDSTETIKYRMPTYIQNGNLVHFAAYKNHIGFYPTPSGIEKFAKELSNFITSKGAIQFPIDKELPYDLIKKIVELRVNENLTKISK